MKRIDTYIGEALLISEGLISGRTRAIKPVVEALRDAFQDLLGPYSRKAADELRDMMDTLPGAKKCMTCTKIEEKWIKENDPIFICFSIWKTRVGSSVYLGRPNNDLSSEIDIVSRKVHLKVGKINMTSPFVYDFKGSLWVRSLYDTWVIDKKSPVWDVFRDALENLGK